MLSETDSMKIALPIATTVDGLSMLVAESSTKIIVASLRIAARCGRSVMHFFSLERKTPMILLQNQEIVDSSTRNKIEQVHETQGHANLLWVCRQKTSV